MRDILYKRTDGILLLNKSLIQNRQTMTSYIDLFHNYSIILDLILNNYTCKLKKIQLTEVDKNVVFMIILLYRINKLSLHILICFIIII